MTDFSFGFEELPLIVEDGFEAGLVNGTACIGWNPDGEWWVRGITLDGYGSKHERKPVTVALDTHQQIYLAIIDRLEHTRRFKDSIDDTVQKAMEDQREAGGRRQRSDQEEHSTLNPAQQGV